MMQSQCYQPETLLFFSVFPLGIQIWIWIVCGVLSSLFLFFSFWCGSLNQKTYRNVYRYFALWRALCIHFNEFNSIFTWINILNREFGVALRLIWSLDHFEIYSEKTKKNNFGFVDVGCCWMKKYILIFLTIQWVLFDI